MRCQNQQARADTAAVIKLTLWYPTAISKWKIILSQVEFVGGYKSWLCRRRWSAEI